MKANACELCELAVPPVYRDDKLSVILVDDPNYPGFCRVIWNDHVREMSDLSPADRMLLNDAVWHVETAVREVMGPDKINVASLGNVVPHLHWHVIPRYVDDVHFPNPVWAACVRQPDEKSLAARRARLARLSAAIVERMTNR
jgi:diadenosine tetraphosphate (Ap4A) HIT family hydrolase